VAGLGSLNYPNRPTAQRGGGALARLLAIDLWRWRTKRATLADLGWIAA